MSKKKYNLISEARMFRLIASQSFSSINEGERGGLVGSPDNLSHDGNCWIFENAEVFGNARVCGNAQIRDRSTVFEGAVVSDGATTHGNSQTYGSAQLLGNAIVYENAQVCGSAMVCEDSVIGGNALIYGTAHIYGDAKVLDYAQIYDFARVHSYANVRGYAQVGGNARIEYDKDYLTIGPVGKGRYITAIKSNKIVHAGCFSGTLDEFKKAVAIKYPNGSDYDFFFKAIENYFLSKINQKL